MGGIFGVASKSSCVLDLFFGIDYHSHLGPEEAEWRYMILQKDLTEHSQYREFTFQNEIRQRRIRTPGNLGIGCISDNEPQPLLVRSHLGNFAITTVGKINNMEELVAHSFKNGCTHFLEMSGGNVNPTEMVASLINQNSTMVEGIRYAQEMIDGSMSMLILTPKGLVAARDLLGRTPLIIGKKENARCVSFEATHISILAMKMRRSMAPERLWP